MSDSLSDLCLIYRDDCLVAINKPAGLLVHRSRVDVRARQFAMQLLRDQIGARVFPVHRLDRPTSGVLLFALSPEIATQVGRQFEERTIKKEYAAIVRGCPALSGVWDEPLVERHDRMTDKRAQKDKPPQDAITEFRTERSWEVPFSAGKYPSSRYSLVRINPRTGRKHQIRRHFNHMAHPVVGDTTHGDRRHNRLFRDHIGVRRLLLASTRMELVHPVTGQPLAITCGLGSEFDQAIKTLDSFQQLKPTAKQ